MCYERSIFACVCLQLFYWTIINKTGHFCRKVEKYTFGFNCRLCIHPVIKVNVMICTWWGFVHFYLCVSTESSYRLLMSLCRTNFATKTASVECVIISCALLLSSILHSCLAGIAQCSVSLRRHDSCLYASSGDKRYSRTLGVF